MEPTARRANFKLVVLPGWWFELLCVAAAAGALLVIVPRSHLPELLPLGVFLTVLLIAENSTLVWLPSSVGVDSSFLIIMAAIAAFGGHGAVLGASFMGLGAGITLTAIRNGRYTGLLFNCSQYLLASAAAAYVYVAIGGGAAKPVAFVAAISVFALINYTLVIPQIVLNLQVPLRAVWADVWPVAPNYFAFGLLGVLIGSLYRSLGWVTLPLVIVPAAIARNVLSSFMDLREAQDATVRVFIRAIEAKDPYTAGHTERVAKYAVYIGEELRLSQTHLDHLKHAALLHDVGKLAVPKHILNKPGKLTEDEYAIVRRHNQVCIDILTRVDFMRSMVGTASDQHAHFAGGNAEREQTRLVQEAHIVAVADAFDAMTSTRSYRRALTQEIAFLELREKAGTQFSPKCVEALARALEKRGERYGLGYEEAVAEFDVEPPVVGVGSAGLGDLLPPVTS
jgi:hypothetical protein